MGTNKIEHGLSQTRRDPSIEGEYLFLMGPQLSIGLLGGNASFLNEENHIHLKTFINLNVDVDADVYFRFRYGYNHFSQTNSRDSNSLSFMMHLYGILGKISQESNFENTHSSSLHYSLGYRWQLNPQLNWENNIEVNNLTTGLYSSYYDYESKLEYIYTNMSLFIGFSTATSRAQFQGRAEPTLFIQIQSRF